LRLGRRPETELVAKHMLAEHVLTDRIALVALRQVDTHDRTVGALAQRLAGNAHQPNVQCLGEPPGLPQVVAETVEGAKAQ
jgi:hypothetical protein